VPERFSKGGWEADTPMNSLIHEGEQRTLCLMFNSTQMLAILVCHKHCRVGVISRFWRKVSPIVQPPPQAKYEGWGPRGSR